MPRPRSRAKAWRRVSGPSASFSMPLAIEDARVPAHGVVRSIVRVRLGHELGGAVARLELEQGSARRSGHPSHVADRRPAAPAPGIARDLGGVGNADERLRSSNGGGGIGGGAGGSLAVDCCPASNQMLTIVGQIDVASARILIPGT